MRAEIVSVGTELLLGTTIDTNAAAMGEILAACGIACTHRQTVGDNLERVTNAFRLALSRAEIVVAIGGLGPTQDDLTRDGIAAAIGEPLELDTALEAYIRGIFEGRGLRWVESNARQAMRPPSGRPLMNERGTAPGLWIEKDGKVVVALPGPPREFLPMAQGEVRSRLARLSGDRVIHSRILRVCGVGESRVEEILRDLMEGSNPTLAPYAKTMEVHLRLTAAAASVEEAEALISPLEAKVRERLGWHLYGTDDTDLENAVHHALDAHGATVAVAESCTGGLLGSRLTHTAGASATFLGGVICYSEASKQRDLDVPAAMLEEHGAVSAPVAQAIAEGVRERFGSTFGVGITGVAGPGPDDRDQPEGRVFVALATPDETVIQQHQLGRGRDAIRTRAAQLALTLLWQTLISRPAPAPAQGRPESPQ